MNGWRRGHTWKNRKGDVIYLSIFPKSLQVIRGVQIRYPQMPRHLPLELCLHSMQLIGICICDFMKLLIPNEVFLGTQKENAAATISACFHIGLVLGLINAYTEWESTAGG